MKYLDEPNLTTESGHYGGHDLIALHGTGKLPE